MRKQRKQQNEQRFPNSFHCPKVCATGGTIFEFPAMSKFAPCKHIFLRSFTRRTRKHQNEQRFANNFHYPKVCATGGTIFEFRAIRNLRLASTFSYSVSRAEHENNKMSRDFPIVSNPRPFVPLVALETEWWHLNLMEEIQFELRTRSSTGLIFTISSSNKDA